MLMTRVRPNELLGKKVYDKAGRVIGEVVGIAGRHGTVRGVVVRNGSDVRRIPERVRAPRLKVLH